MKIKEKEIVNLYITRRKSIDYISKKMGVSYTTVRKILKNNNVEFRRRGRIPKPSEPYLARLEPAIKSELEYHSKRHGISINTLIEQCVVMFLSQAVVMIQDSES